jgi:2-keto-4-pentenoate hydratase/2-oxohepta-3-ene-1,7-dioic acid hydratase in catechol pathway
LDRADVENKYKQHAAEVKMDIPTVPTLFMKPSTALTDPFPATIPLPRMTKKDDCGDWESELAVLIGKDCKNISEAEVSDYILGYTASNDVSSRVSQLNQSQWCFSKGFDGSCPIGKLASSSLIQKSRRRS